MSLVTSTEAPPTMLHAGVLDLVGNTPVVDVSRLSPNPNVRVNRRSSVKKSGPLPILRPAPCGRWVFGCLSPTLSNPTSTLKGRAEL